jgi:hypothetical protein
MANENKELVTFCKSMFSEYVGVKNIQVRCIIHPILVLQPQNISVIIAYSLGCL